MAELDRIRTFLRVVERGSLTAAAKQMDAPLTSVSRKIAALEGELGVRLLHRTTRRVSVTQAGRDYYERCLRAEAILDEAGRLVRMQAEEPMGTLRVLAPYSLGISVLEPAWPEFRRRHPHVGLELTLDNGLLDLVEHGFDVVLHRGPMQDSGYSFRRIGRSQAKLVASPRYLDLNGRPAEPGELSRHALLALGRGVQASWLLRDGSGGTSEIKFQPVFRSNDSLPLVRQTIGGAGIALVSTHMMARHVEEGRLEVVLPDWHRSDDTDLAVLFAPQATSDRKVRLFVDFCVEIFSALPELKPP